MTGFGARMEVRVTIAASWQLVARAPGQFTVPAPTMRWKGKRLTGTPITVEVVPASGRPRQPPQGRPSKQHHDEARDRKAAHDPQPDRPPGKRLAGPQRHRKPAQRRPHRQPKKHLKHPNNLLPPPARAPRGAIGGRGIQLIGACR